MGKKKNLAGLNIFVIALAVIYALVLIIGNVKTVKSNVAVAPGSYGETFANEKKLNIVELADSQEEYFDQRYEEFDYNKDGSELTLEAYRGKSTDLVIPREIAGKKVTALGEDFFSSLDSVKNLYISDSIKTIEGEPDATVNICCSEDNGFYLDNADEGWTFETTYDSTFVNYGLGDLEFEYNQNGDSIEITRYTGDDYKVVVIPSYINGYPVTSVSLDFLKTAELIVIPQTVTQISGTVSVTLFTPVFAIELIFTILAIVISLITVDILLPRYSKDIREYMLTGNQMAAVILYVLFQTAFSIATVYFVSIPAYLALIVSLVLLIVFVAAVMLGGAGRKHVTQVEKNTEAKTSRMKAIKLAAKGLSEGIKDPETRKTVTRLEEEIRFSDPVTREDLDDIESDIEDGIRRVRAAVSEDDNEKIRSEAEKLMNLVSERNKLCKAGK